MKLAPQRSETPKPKSSKHKALLTLTAKEWPKDQPMLDLKTTNKQKQTFAEKLPILEGEEPVELLLDWIQKVSDAIVPKEGRLAWNTIQECLLRLTRNGPRNVLRTALEELKDDQIVWNDDALKFPFHNLIYKSKMESFMTAAALNAYKQTEEYHRIILQEVMYRLLELYFGTDCVGRNAFNYNRNVVIGFRCEIKKGIRYWHVRLTELRKLLVLLPWKAGERRGETAQDYSDMELRSHLANALTKAQFLQLFKIGWDIFDHAYNETIDKLESIEPELKAELEQEARLRKLEEAKIPKKRERSGTPKDKGDVPECKICGKKHRGECWLKDKSKNKRPKKGGFTNTQFAQLKAMMAANRANVSEEESTNSNAPEWTKGLDRAEQMFIINEYKRDHDGYMDSDDEVTTIGVDELKEYKRKAKKAVKKFTY